MNGMLEVCAQEGNNFQSSVKKRQGSIIQISAEDIANNKYSIRDVILPLPGHNVILPNNQMAAVYENLLVGDGLKMNDYSTCNITYRMSGAYRRLLQVHSNLPYNIIFEKLNYISYVL